MNRIILVLALQTVCLVPCMGQEFDGVCRITSANGKQWSGVAISDKEILSVAHPEENGVVRVEFCEGSHGSFNRVGLQAKLIRADRAKDLALLGYTVPNWMTVKAYPVAEDRGIGSVRGFIGDNCMDSPVEALGVSGVVTGYPVITMRAPKLAHLVTRAGMSGSPILTDGGVRAIQFGEHKVERTIDVVTVETIRVFLAEE